MKKVLTLCACVLSAAMCAAQAPSTAPEWVGHQLSIVGYPTPQVTTAAAWRSAGNPGLRTLYYWIVANGVSDSSSPAGPFAVSNAPDALSASAKVTVSWQPVAGASSYDVLRTSTNQPPSANCNCAVATGVTSTSKDDISETLQSYNPTSAGKTVFTLTNEQYSAGVQALRVRFKGSPIFDWRSDGVFQVSTLAVGTTVVLGDGHQAIDISRFGAKCDGTTDDTAALQAAITAAGSNGGQILIPGTATASCYIANPASITWPNFAGTLTILIKGMMKVGTTFTVPDGVDLVGQGGGGYPQFLGTGTTAAIQGLTTNGTLGTSFSAGTQTFTPSSMTGVYPGTGLTVVGNVTCSISSVSRTSNVVTATLSSSCRIPPGAGLTIAGVSDSSFNGSFMAIASDYGLNTVMWRQTASNGSSSGGTVTGLNEDSVETVLVTATTSTTATARFQRAHNSADKFGVVVLATKGSSFGHKSFRSLSVGGCGGACIWLNYVFYTGLYDVGASANQVSTSVPLVLSTSSFITIEGGTYSGGVWSAGAPTATPIPWGIHMTEYDPDTNDGNATGALEISNARIQRGVKIDTGGLNPRQLANGIKFRKNTFERVAAAVRIDPRNTNSLFGIIDLDNNFLQDNLDGFLASQLCTVVYTDYSGGKGGANIKQFDNSLSMCRVGGYFDGALQTEGAVPQLPSSNVTVPPGTHMTGKQIEAEIRGEGASFGPQIVPYASLNVPNPTTWSSGACSVTQGVLAPDGSTTAVSLTYSSGIWMTVGSANLTPHNGDYILYGGWIRGSGTNGGGATTRDGAFWLNSTNATDWFVNQQYPHQHNMQTFQSFFGNDWWSPVVALAQFQTTDGGTHSYQFNIECPDSGGGSLQMWSPFMIYVPNTVPADEVARIRQQILHGYVPPNVPAQALAMNPNHKLYWGSDTNLYRDGTNGLKTDNAFHAVGAIKTDACSGYLKNDGTCGSGGASVAQVLDFTTSTAPSGAGGSAGSWTYTIPTGVTAITAYVMGGGAGGGSGATCANTSATCYGGGAGSAGAVQMFTLPASFFGGAGASITVNVGAGGNGGNAQSGNSASGNNGSYGNTSSVCGPTNYGCISASSGNSGSGSPGSGGTTSSGTGGIVSNSITAWGVCGGAGGSSGAGGNQQCVNTGTLGAAGGAGGGGLVNGTTAAGGGQSGPSGQQYRFAQTAANTSGGSSGGGAGQTPSYSGANVTAFLSAMGGTGGGSNCAGNGGKGGDGMFPGGGGAGGGAACNGYSSGAGGKGGDGLVRLIVQ